MCSYFRTNGSCFHISVRIRQEAIRRNFCCWNTFKLLVIQIAWREEHFTGFIGKGNKNGVKSVTLHFNRFLSPQSTICFFLCTMHWYHNVIGQTLPNSYMDLYLIETKTIFFLFLKVFNSLILCRTIQKESLELYHDLDYEQKRMLSTIWNINS